MALKKLLALFAMMLLTLSLQANETTTDVNCEEQYNICEEKCISANGEEKEACLEKCDDAYSKCIDKTQEK